MKHLVPMNLQFFNESNTAGTDTPPADAKAGEQTPSATPPPATPPAIGAEPPAGQGNQPPPTKTYSQKEYDDMMVKQLNAGIAKAMKEAGFEGISQDDFKKNLSTFKKWQDEQKTEAQKQQEALAAAQKLAEDSQAELITYRQNDLVRGAGVDDKYIGFVSFEVSQLAKSKGIEFGAALTEFLESNKDQYTKAAQPTTPPTTHTMTFGTGDGKPSNQPKDAFNFNYQGVRPRPTN